MERFLGPQTPEKPLSHQQPMGEKSYLPASCLDRTKEPLYISSEERCLPASLRKCAFVLGLGEVLSMGRCCRAPKEASKWAVP